MGWNKKATVSKKDPTIQSNPYFSRNQSKDWELDKLKNHQELSRMDFTAPRKHSRIEYSFGYETQTRKVDSRISMDESYTHHEIETYSRVYQNDYFDPITSKKIKKTTKEIQRSLEKMTQHIDQLSIHWQEIKNILVSYTEEITNESRLENFQIENLADKIEEK